MSEDAVAGYLGVSARTRGWRGARGAFIDAPGEALQLRLFGGSHIEEIVPVTKQSEETNRRDLRMAQNWLSEALGGARRNAG